MAMLKLAGRITDTGKLEVELPEGLPSGDVQVIIELPDGEARPDGQPLADEEIKELMQVEPMAGADIVAAGLTGGWEDLGIQDSLEWMQELRRKRRERRGW
jgi:hypothetical protein